MMSHKKKDSEPMTATKRLLAGLRDGKMADVELVGDDGIRVPALRCVLACASPVMHNLLYGDPARASSSVVKISGCSNKTLRALVEYCCSDELNASIWDGSCPPAEIVKDIVALARVSHAYGIPNMEERVLEGINPLMAAIPPLACVVFNYADPSTTRAIHKSALAMIREKPYVCLQQEGQNVGGMICLSPEKLQEVIRDTGLQVDELFLFKQLIRWRSYNRNVYANATAICKQLVSYIDLNYIDPGDIKNFVIDSGLVEDKSIIDALLEQSIAATREGLAYAAMRGNMGKDQIYAMVQGAGTPECNGLYKQIHKEGTLMCYGKVVDEKRMMLLLKDNHTSWKICDHETLYYEWTSHIDSHHDQYPVSGWVAASHNASTMPTPTIKWFRPRGKSPRLPRSAAPSSSSSVPHLPPASTRIPINPASSFDGRPSPGEKGLSSTSHLHQHIRHHHSMDETDSHSRGESNSPTPMSQHLRRTSSRGEPISPTPMTPHSRRSPSPQSSYPQHSGLSSSSSSGLPSHLSSPSVHHGIHSIPSREHHAYHNSSASQHSSAQSYHHHHHHRDAPRGATNSPQTPVAVRISPRTPSPRLSFSTMPPVKESVSWAI
ncbi:BTB POZ domain containing [Seminavis robusta]|uniref:BTB POZ domain containing n=1 Tax=Seminavis robusta TaxID=568900 RepID=A0A9N8DWE1_9STRA|nr:BTB POZ domain containing [Seminavis robusta]|eukprot:Sro330_g119000.1 BTB POZ domain containing (606) ;mRNA; r:62517-64334